MMYLRTSERIEKAARVDASPVHDLDHFLRCFLAECFVLELEPVVVFPELSDGLAVNSQLDNHPRDHSDRQNCDHVDNC